MLVHVQERLIVHLLLLVLVGETGAHEKVTALVDLLAVVLGVHRVRGKARHRGLCLDAQVVHQVSFVADQSADACSIAKFSHLVKPLAQVQKASSIGHIVDQESTNCKTIVRCSDF